MNPERNTSSDMHQALWQALVVTAIVIVVLKSLTGIVWFGALLVAAIVFSVSLGWMLRTRRGIRR
ncbi:MAG: hypothetical protein ACR2OU_18655 [Thermomicrobiales bacterium]